MTPRIRRRYRSLTVALAAAAVIAGCGGGAAVDDIGRGAANAVGAGADEALRGGTAFGDDGSRAFPTLTAPARRAATRVGTAGDELDRTAQATYDAFCEGWGIYKSTGGFPTPDQWAGIAEERIESVAIPYPVVVVRAVSAYQSVEYAFETGNVTAAQIDLFCAVR
jgi:hypothetical protein